MHCATYIHLHLPINKLSLYYQNKKNYCVYYHRHFYFIVFLWIFIEQMEHTAMNSASMQLKHTCQVQKQLKQKWLSPPYLIKLGNMGEPHEKIRRHNSWNQKEDSLSKHSIRLYAILASKLQCYSFKIQALSSQL